MQREPFSATSDAAADGERYRARVEALITRIAAAAPEIERSRRVPPDLLEALHDAELYRMLIPRRYGGGEVHPLVFMRTMQALARADASVAWNIGQNAVCAIVAAYLEPEVAEAIFGDPRAVLAWGPAQGPARAVVCDGGYRVSGRWSFASGMRQATWLGPQCPVFEADGSPRRTGDAHRRKRVFLIPASAARLEDIWDVIGLRGTASDAFSVEDLYVPEAYSVHRESTVENREPGWLYDARCLHRARRAQGAARHAQRRARERGCPGRRRARARQARFRRSLSDALAGGDLQRGADNARSDACAAHAHSALLDACNPLRA